MEHRSTSRFDPLGLVGILLLVAMGIILGGAVLSARQASGAPEQEPGLAAVPADVLAGGALAPASPDVTAAAIATEETVAVAPTVGAESGGPDAQPVAPIAPPASPTPPPTATAPLAEVVADVPTVEPINETPEPTSMPAPRGSTLADAPRCLQLDAQSAHPDVPLPQHAAGRRRHLPRRPIRVARVVSRTALRI